MKHIQIGSMVLAVLLGGVTFVGIQTIFTPEATEDADIQDSRDAISLNSVTQQPEVRKKVLRDANLSEVPPDVFSDTKITSLDLSNNNLSGSLPAEVRQLQNLKVLDLSHNNFTGVPAEIGQLSKLEILILSDNPITGLPLELGNLKNLRILDLRNTQYSEYDLNTIRKSLSTDVEIKL